MTVSTTGAAGDQGDQGNQEDRDWRAFALLLIDVQSDFWAEPVAAAFPDFPRNVAHLLACCRREGIGIVHLRAGFAPDGSDWMVNARLRGRVSCLVGTPGAGTLPYAREQPGEAVIVKHSWDGFQTPELSASLRQNGKRFLLIAGLVTSVCVLFTAASAAQQGFLTAVIDDCCGDRPEAHEQALQRYRGLVFRSTTVGNLLDDYAAWSADLARIAAMEPDVGTVQRRPGGMV